jgi:hypothetical protein
VPAGFLSFAAGVLSLSPERTFWGGDMAAKDANTALMSRVRKLPARNAGES